MAVFADPLDLLGAMNPVPDERVLPAASAYVPAQRTLQRILSQSLPLATVPAPDPWATDGDDGGEAGGEDGGRRGRRSKRLVVGVAVATVGLVAAAAAWVATRPADNPAPVACFAAADLQADTAPLAAELARDPVAACEEVWRTGAFREWGAVPPLAACVLERGVVGVFPGEPSVCDRLGLARLATESGDWNARVTQLVDGLTAELAYPSCVDVDVAADLVRQRLDELALHGWTLIAPATAVPERPCASVAFDPPARTITIVPVPLPGD